MQRLVLGLTYAVTQHMTADVEWHISCTLHKGRKPRGVMPAPRDEH